MMAGYRPKSLDELNSIFDKTMAAEKAIKKSSSLLEKGEDSFTSFSSVAEAEPTVDSADADEEKPSEEITDSVSDFIARFSASSETEPVKAKPKMTVISPEAPKKEHVPEFDIFSEESEAPAKGNEKTSRDELFDEYMKIMSDEDDDAPSEKKLSRKEKKRLKKKEKAESKPAEEAPAEDQNDETEEAFADAAPETETDIEACAEDAPSAEEAVQEASSEAENDDFDFPENYTPEWIKEEDEAQQQEKKKPVKDSSKTLRTLLRVVLSLVLVAVISVGALATVFKTVLAVNTGKLISDRYYVFTTYKDYADLGIGEGELVITEKKYAEDGEIFAYVDYGSKTFEFGRRTDSITKEDGEMLYVTEKDGGRTLVSRDDCKGVVYLTYDNRGNIVSLLTDNYIVIIAAVAVTSLVIVLIFALVLRKKKDESPEEEEAEEEFSEETEEEFEDIFSTVE